MEAEEDEDLRGWEFELVIVAEAEVVVLVVIIVLFFLLDLLPLFVDEDDDVMLEGTAFPLLAIVIVTRIGVCRFESVLCAFCTVNDAALADSPLLLAHADTIMLSGRVDSIADIGMVTALFVFVLKFLLCLTLVFEYLNSLAFLVSLFEKLFDILLAKPVK
jgi:hypothetical protein